MRSQIGRGNKVAVQPFEPEATTNMFIWTASGRLNYELVLAPSVQDMHLAIDQKSEATVAKGTDGTGEIRRGSAQAAQEAKLDSRLCSLPNQKNGRSIYMPGTPGVLTLWSSAIPAR